MAKRFSRSICARRGPALGGGVHRHRTATPSLVRAVGARAVAHRDGHARQHHPGRRVAVLDPGARAIGANGRPSPACRCAWTWSSAAQPGLRHAVRAHASSRAATARRRPSTPRRRRRRPTERRYEHRAATPASADRHRDAPTSTAIPPSAGHPLVPPGVDPAAGGDADADVHALADAGEPQRAGHLRRVDQLRRRTRRRAPDTTGDHRRSPGASATAATASGKTVDAHLHARATFNVTLTVTNDRGVSASTTQAVRVAASTRADGRLRLLAHGADRDETVCSTPTPSTCGGRPQHHAVQLGLRRRHRRDRVLTPTTPRLHDGRRLQRRRSA